MGISGVAGRLEGKVCVITGTGGSMGRAAALTFAREGALVVGCDVAVDPAAETVDLVQAAGGQMVSLQPCRVSDPAECPRLVDLAISSYGRIDVLYNLAARSHFNRLEDFGDADWEAARRDEVDLVFYLTRAAAWKEGCIVTGRRDRRGSAQNEARIRAQLQLLVAGVGHLAPAERAT